MALATETTAQVVKTYQRGKNDTGSSEVQIALLSTRINDLTGHLKTHTHDFHSRYGLTILVSKRRRLLRYFKRVNPKGYKELITKLEVRG